MAEIKEDTWNRQDMPDGSWRATFKVVRADGEEVNAQVSCTPGAVDAARTASNATALDYMTRLPAVPVLQQADRFRAPSVGGPTFFCLWFDPNDEGNPRLTPS